jgi:hypothetical protein
MTGPELHALIHDKSTGQTGRLVLYCRGATAAVMCCGGPEAVIRPRVEPGHGMSYTQVEISPDPAMGPGAWRLLNQTSGEVVAEGTVEP